MGNLSYSVTGKELGELFSRHGEVREAIVIEGRGFDFVQMSSSLEAQKAKKALDSYNFKGRAFKVDEARPPRERRDRRRY